MAIDLLTLFGSVLIKKAVSTGIDIASQKSLSNDLNKTVESWAKNLPPGKHLVPSALFDSTLLDSENPSPEVIVLAKTIDERKIPRKNVWFDAILYLWKKKKHELGADAQDFFLLSPEDSKPHLELLAAELAMTCIENKSLFQGTVITSLDEVMAGINNVQSLLTNTLSATFSATAATSVQASSHLLNSLFICEYPEISKLGLAVSNSGLIVCSGTNEDPISIKSLKSKQAYQIERHWKEEGFLDFIQIKEKTEGVVPIFPNRSIYDEPLFTFDNDGNVISAKQSDDLWHTSYSLAQGNFWIENILRIEVDGITDRNKLSSSPVFNADNEFIGFSFATASRPLKNVDLFTSPEPENNRIKDLDLSKLISQLPVPALDIFVQPWSKFVSYYYQSYSSSSSTA